MKNFMFFFALLAAGRLSAQWNVVYHDSDKTYADADFPGNDDIYVIGSRISGNSFVLHSTDGGLNWTEQPMPFPNLSKICMRNTQEGYIAIAGTAAQLLYTTNGFATYTSHTIELCYSVQGLRALTDSSGFFLLNGGRLRSFNNYGASQGIITGNLTNASGMCFADTAVGYVGNGNQLVKTVNGGNTWGPFNNSSPFLSLISFTARDTGYSSDIITQVSRTYDGGISFQQALAFPAQYLASFGSYVAAADAVSTVKWSPDYGQNWTSENTGTTELNGIFIDSSAACYAFNNLAGDILKKQLTPEGIFSAGDHVRSITVFPNPVKEYLQISGSGLPTHAGARLELYNTMGSLVRTEERPDCNRIAVGNLEEGVYFLRLCTDEGRQVQTRFVKCR
ncbi:MAG: hypothetical protein FD123_3236 [Bacteroidetes bacterium]|nr:MAG: hypothetical protein FD123_3236 [Bacteroidota bacterium]